MKNRHGDCFPTLHRTHKGERIASLEFVSSLFGCIRAQENKSVGAKHDRSEYEIISNNLYAVMLRPLQKPDAPLSSENLN
jgi:hypothetical protein